MLGLCPVCEGGGVLCNEEDVGDKHFIDFECEYCSNGWTDVFEKVADGSWPEAYEYRYSDVWKG